MRKEMPASAMAERADVVASQTVIRDTQDTAATLATTAPSASRQKARTGGPGGLSGWRSVR